MNEAASNLQYGALPFRRDRSSAIEIMLITSRDTGRWIIPKGWPMAGREPWESAAQEAREEAGLVGVISKQSVGQYPYVKRKDDGSAAICLVEVFPLEVSSQLRRWPEKDERQTRWFAPLEGAGLVQEPGLKEIIERFAARS